MTNSKKFYGISVFASSISAVCTKTVVAPFERLKLLKQSQVFCGGNNYGSIISSLKYIHKNEGIRGFYRGNFSNLIRVIPAYGLKFPLNEYFKNIFIINKDNPRFDRLLLSGALAGLTQTCLTYPLDTLRTRMSLDKTMTKNYTNIYQCLYTIIKNEGVSALYKGLNINAISYPLYVGVQFSIYEKLKDQNPFIAGTVAGTIAQSIMYPGDTIKRQLQLSGIDKTGKKIGGVFGSIKYIYMTKGFTGFYQGFIINLIKVDPEATIQFMVYDYIKKILTN